MEKVDFDDHVASYDEFYEQVGFFSDDHEYFAAYKMKIVSELSRQTPNSILEYGCGTGRNLKHIKNEFESAKISGCDISAESLRVAGDENPDVDLYLLGEQAIEKQFDMIVIAGLFHHVTPELRMSTMNDIFNLLNSNGEVFIFENNPYNPVTMHLMKKCPFDTDAIVLKPKEMRSIIKGFDFDIVSFKYTLFIPNSFKKLKFLENYLGWLPLGGQYFFHLKKN